MMRKIWPGTKTRHATPEEIRMALWGVTQLRSERLSVILVPAPDERFSGHRIRAVEMRNPAWYRLFVAGRWDRRGCQVKRGRVMKALLRVTELSIVRGNGYEGRLLMTLAQEWKAKNGDA